MLPASLKVIRVDGRPGRSLLSEERDHFTQNLCDWIPDVHHRDVGPPATALLHRHRQLTAASRMFGVGRRRASECSLAAFGGWIPRAGLWGLLPPAALRGWAHRESPAHRGAADGHGGSSEMALHRETADHTNGRRFESTAFSLTTFH